MADYISRDGILDKFASKFCAYCPLPDCDTNCKLHYLLDAVKEEPAADVRPVVRGKWIEEYECTHPQAKCSACGEPTLYAVSYDIKGNAYYMNFCPNCGADMREVKSDEK